MESRRFYVITGGTMVHVAPHFSLCAPAYGKVGHQIASELEKALTAQRVRETSEGRRDGNFIRFLTEEERAEIPKVVPVRTNMARGPSSVSGVEKELFDAAGIRFLETNEDLEKLIDYLVLQPETKGIVLAAAVCDWQPKRLEVDVPDYHDNHLRDEFGKRQERLKTSEGNLRLAISPADKIIGKIRQKRKDIFLVGFKATTGMSEQEQYVTGLGLLKGASCNLVLANDVHEHRNMVITPEEAKYHVTKDRKTAVWGLCEMVAMRSQLHFTRSTVIEGEPIPWGSDAVPANLRKVVNHLIARGAYKPFQGKTVGHFATRGPKPGIIYTSRRKTDFNKLPEDGLLRIDTVGEDQVVAHGAKPSVGGQSQRIIFDEHPDVDCIVHAHVPLRDVGDPARQAKHGQFGTGHVLFGVQEQRPYECGSHECGRNASEGLEPVGHGIKAVMLEEHGPNVCFSKDTDPDKVIEYIETFWDLEAKTGGPVSLGTT